MLTIFMFESQLIQMPGPGTSSFIGPAPGISCCAKAPELGTHFGAKAPGCPGGMVTSQIDTCKTKDIQFEVGLFLLAVK